MIQKPLFNLNSLYKNSSDVFIVLPELNNFTIDFLNLCLNLAKKFRKTVFLCSEYEISFYNLLIEKSKSFAQFKDKIAFETSSHYKLSEIQLKDCIILHLHHNHLDIENAKRAIICQPNNDSDLVFLTPLPQTKTTNKSMTEGGQHPEKNDNMLDLEYIRNLLSFIHIKEELLIKSIDLNPKDVIQASPIARNYTNKKYSVIFIRDLIASIKIINFFKKNKLKKNLILVSQNPIGIADTKLLALKEYCYLDLLAFMIQAESISCTKNNINKNIIGNLRINLSVFAILKDYSALLYDITEPI